MFEDGQKFLACLVEEDNLQELEQGTMPSPIVTNFICAHLPGASLWQMQSSSSSNRLGKISRTPNFRSSENAIQRATMSTKLSNSTERPTIDFRK